MPTGGLPEAVLKEVKHREYWEKSHTQWGNTNKWDRYFYENVQDATRHMSHNALSADLRVLIQKLKPGTRASKKALAMNRDLKDLKRNGNSLSENPPSTYDDNIKDEEGSNLQTYPITEELTFDPHIAALLLPYRRILKEMRNHHMEEELQQARHLSLMLKWSVVDYSLFKGSKFCPNLHRPAVNMILLESVLMETKNSRHLHHAVMIVHTVI